MTEAKYRTITLTDRPPVRIREDAWPIIARASDWEGEFEFQANRKWTIIVRQNREDGRTIVYGLSESEYPGEMNLRCGELLTPPEGTVIVEEAWFLHDDLVGAIHRVAERCGCSCIADACIADLPAQEL